MENQNYIPNEPLAGLKRAKKIVLSILIIMVLIAVGWFIYISTKGPVVLEGLPESYVVNNLGSIPQGFPVELILNRDSSNWQRSEDTLNGEGERIRIVEFIYPKATETFLAELDKHIESFSWEKVESGNSNNSLYHLYELSGDRLIVTTLKTKNGLLTNMTLITQVLD